MMWDFKREEQQFDTVPVGKHRLRIKEAKMKVSKSGNDMVEIKMEVSGHTSWIFHYIVFLPDRPQITNRNLTALFDSFGIADGDFNVAGWAGKVGAGMVKHDDQDRAQIAYLIHRNRQDDLPGWKEPGGARATAAASDQFTPMDGEPEDLPF